ncbi:unnamed protein product (plasmid) [Mycetohabitans rhizoxinica HKI 454]|uniref:Uncharacterized protein n=1 Tax=Mycetohabitans rhizoxinica (strain DSM 19002 / CIP 109453 / HKI 454) TaxID=882378 RepID=E5ATK6_MYCRK|nr:unnamed protein product [Mycetohabitans rhizoxinica HKI 454]
MILLHGRDAQRAWFHHLPGNEPLLAKVYLRFVTTV